MDETFRIYEPDELGSDGYPVPWHSSIKYVVRQQAGHHCVRCLHPFVVGESGYFEGPEANVKAMAASIGVNSETLDEALFDMPLEDARVLTAPRMNWSTCAANCRHGGPIRVGHPDHGWRDFGDSGEARRYQLILATSRGYGIIEAAWRILTVHHLNGNKADCRWWNLAALCQRCHLEIQGRVKMEQIYPFEHTDWFKPYAAGYYAVAYLGEDLDREQTEDRLDELLALERA